MKAEYKYYLIIAGIVLSAAIVNNLRLGDMKINWFDSPEVWEKPL